MIIKLSKVISCSSEHPKYPASNLLQYPTKSSWQCAKPNELTATVTLQFVESSAIVGLEIGNHCSCIVIVEASTCKEPDNYKPIVNHQFLSYDEAANNKFRDQVQIFTKRDLNPETTKIKFDKVKITCMQPANPRILFGLGFIIFKTEIIVDLGLDVFGRFKLKEKNDDNVDEFKEKYLKIFGQKSSYKDELKNDIINSGITNFEKRSLENREPRKRPILQKMETDVELDINKPCSSNNTTSCIPNDALPSKKANPITRTLFGDVISSPKQKKKEISEVTSETNLYSSNKKRQLDPSYSVLTNSKVAKREHCSLCDSNSDQLCQICKLLPVPKPCTLKKHKKSKQVMKQKKEFCKLFEDVSFALSGYVNPQRDELRKKALKMGAKYNANPNVTNNKCTHLICAFKNTPKSQQLKNHCKIVGHKFIEDCFNERKRFPWRRYALDSQEKSQPESEEEIDGSSSPISQSSIFDQETDDSDSNY